MMKDRKAENNGTREGEMATLSGWTGIVDELLAHEKAQSLPWSKEAVARSNRLREAGTAAHAEMLTAIQAGTLTISDDEQATYETSCDRLDAAGIVGLY